MYYSFYYIFVSKCIKTFTALLILSFSLLPFQTLTFAESFGPVAEDYRAKGYEQQERGNYERAIQFYTKALSLGLENAVLYNDIGVVYEHMGVWQRAKEHYLKALRLDQDYLPPYTNLAYLYLRRGEKFKASQYFRERYDRARDDDPWREQAKAELLRLDPRFKSDLLQEKVETLSQELEHQVQQEFSLQIERAERHYQRGWMALQQKDYEQALGEFDRALALTPDNPKIIKERQRAERELLGEDIKHRVQEVMKDLESGDYQSAKSKIQELLPVIPNESFQESE